MRKKKEKGSLFENEIGIDSPADRIVYIRDHVTPYNVNLFNECKTLKEDMNYK